MKLGSRHASRVVALTLSLSSLLGACGDGAATRPGGPLVPDAAGGSALPPETDASAPAPPVPDAAAVLAAAGVEGPWFGIPCASGPCSIPSGWEPRDHVAEAFARARAAVPGFEATVRWANLSFSSPSPGCSASPDTTCLDWGYAFWAGDGDQPATLKSVNVDVKARAIQVGNGPPFDWATRTEGELTPATWQSVASLLKSFRTPKPAFAVGGGDVGEHLGLPGSGPTFCLYPVTGEEYACFDLRTGAKL